MNLKITFFILIVFLWACEKKSSKIPKIEFISNSKQFMVQNGQDSTFIRFSFEDGDGDLGSDVDDNILIKDGRTGQVVSKHKIPNYISNSNNCTKGKITLTIHSQCCIYPDSSACTASNLFPTRTMSYKIQVVDRAGNYSNEIETPTITLDCL